MNLSGVVVSGLGTSAVVRRSESTAIELTIDAVERALADAKLTAHDIDGVATWPGSVLMTPGASGPSIAAVQDTMRLELSWYCAGNEQPGGPFGAIVNAALAVAAGMCSHVLVFRTLTEGSSRRPAPPFRWYDELGPEGVGGSLEWLLPYGAASAAHWLAPYATRYLHAYGKDRSDLYAVAANARLHAGANPDAIYAEPLSLDAYLGARQVVWPLCLYDCDVPVDASSAVIVSAATACNDLARAVRIESVGSALHGRPYYEHWSDLTTMASSDACRALWGETDLTPAEVDVAGLYDGFSILAPLWAEAAGLCARGEGLPFFAAAARGEAGILVNSDGGQLTAGRLHGMGLLQEVCRCLRGEHPTAAAGEVGLATLGGGPVAAAILLTSH